MYDISILSIWSPLTSKILPHKEFLSNRIMFTIQYRNKFNGISMFFASFATYFILFWQNHAYIKFIIHHENSMNLISHFVNYVLSQETNCFLYKSKTSIILLNFWYSRRNFHLSKINCVPFSSYNFFSLSDFLFPIFFSRKNDLAVFEKFFIHPHFQNKFSEKIDSFLRKKIYAEKFLPLFEWPKRNAKW